MNRFGRRVGILALGVMLGGTAMIPAQEVLGPPSGALPLMESAIDRGIFGDLQVLRRDLPLVLTVNGEAVSESLRIFLVPPGEAVFLEARLPREAGSAETFSSDRGYLRQTTHSEIVWEAEEDDRLESTADGRVKWLPGRSGTLSYVTASIAQIEIARNVAQTASGGEAVAAPLATGKRGVLLLSAVSFDRGGDGMLLGQNIGIYPNEQGINAPALVADNAQAYAPPLAFYRLDERARAARVTPHMTLGQMMPPVFPEDAQREERLAPVSPRLLEFYRAFERTLEENKLDPAKISILRGFVSPTERLRLERQGIRLAEFTRFQYGDAIALVYDPNLKSEEKGQVPAIMGDVNGDGSTSIADVEVLAEHARETMKRIGKFGGVGIVGSYEGPGASTGTPYLHIDMRGWLAPFREN